MNKKGKTKKVERITGGRKKGSKKGRKKGSKEERKHKSTSRSCDVTP
jgi:hypothetical protein